jgi:uncharacterized membrane protein
MNSKNTAFSRYTASFGLSLALCSVLNALLVVAKEKSKAISDWMQKLTGHHWITHVLIIMLLFVLLGFAFARRGAQESERAACRVTNTVLAGVIASVAIIMGFYLIAD